MRANLLDELRKPYVVTARAKGLSELGVILKYPVRVALNPFASTIGYTLPYIRRDHRSRPCTSVPSRKIVLLASIPLSTPTR